MQAHPDPDSDATGPVMAGKRALARHAAADRVTSRLEHHEETVALSSHLPAAASGEGGPQ